MHSPPLSPAPADNIETFGSDFYQRRTLSYVLGENEDLWRAVGQHLQPATAHGLKRVASGSLEAA
jgi:hypothetical protein